MSKKEKAKKEKPIEKLTAKELREIAKGIEGVTGVHGMNKDELLEAIRKDRGIEAPASAKPSIVRDVKAKIRELKTKRETLMADGDERKAGFLRKRIVRLKKKTRRAA